VAGGRVITTNYTPAKHPVNAFKAIVALAARQVWSKAPLQGPLRVEVTFWFPLSASARVGVKRQVAGGEWVPHSHKPDLENCVKSLQDALTGICWVDDSQVAEGIWRKGYGATPGVEVSVWGIGNEE
jgi:Holliday junction resolvase RusA-like endonuclease